MIYETASLLMMAEAAGPTGRKPLGVADKFLEYSRR
jgi:hypothetical protein